MQGVVYPEIRRASARALVGMDFPGYAIGGLSVGESTEDMYAMVEVVAPELPPEKPRYLMGVGTPENLIENVARGVDMFDCVMPTRNGRNGTVFTTSGKIHVRGAKWRSDFGPLDPVLAELPGLAGEASATPRAYLRHLFVTNELLGLRIATLQNLTFYLWLMGEMRSAIHEGRFDAWRREWGPRVAGKG